jgi:hypothetical protein
MTKTTMTPELAISILKQCTDVESWNVARETIKNQVKQEDWMANYLPAIDASGLIVEVLGPDQLKGRFNNQ